MNIINKLLLKAALFPKPLYQKLGVNTAQLQTIVATKLLMDDRRPNTFQQVAHKQGQKETSTATLGTMFISALLGVLFLFVFAVGDNIITQLTFFFSMFLFMLASTLITDFTSVLIDVRDNYIILPRPVNDKTVVVARLLHIFIHICKILLPMVLPGVIYMFINNGLAGGLLLFILSLFVVLLTLFFINAVYILILRITTPQKFQNVISYFQIVFAIIVYGGYQIVPRLIGSAASINIDLSRYPAMLLAPPYWFAVAWHTLYTLSGNAIAIILTLCSFIIPVLSIVIVVKYFAPNFNKRLALTGSSDAGTTDVSKIVAKHQQKRSYAQWLAQLVTKHGAERTGFLFTWKMTARSKDFRIKVYPAAGYLLVCFFVIFYNLQGISLQSIQQQTGEGRGVIVFALYLSSMLLLQAIEQMMYSDKFKAAWMFYTAPVAKPGVIIIGALKSILLKFFLPTVIIVACVGFTLIGFPFLPNLLLVIFNMVFISAFTAYISFKALPFSKPQNVKAQSGTFIRNFARVTVLMVLGGMHYALYAITPVIYILAILAAIAAWYVMDSVKQTSWSKLAIADDL